jgi:metal-responsive CopG/Arc/MetJ family transcriptional regulator
MTAILIRLPESLLAAVDRLAEETYTTRSAFVRLACARHIDIVRNVELPAAREFYRKRIPNQLLNNLSNTEE